MLCGFKCCAVNRADVAWRTTGKGKRLRHFPRSEGKGSPPDCVLSLPWPALCLSPHSTWSWHLGQIHMPLGMVFRGGSKQSRWYTREHVSHISNWPLFLQTLQKSSWISPYESERKGKRKDKKVKCKCYMHILDTCKCFRTSSCAPSNMLQE